MRRISNSIYQKPNATVVEVSSDDDDDDADRAMRSTHVSTATPTKASQFDFTSEFNSPCGLAQKPYLPYTINAFNRARLDILPKYPPKDNLNRWDEDDDDDDNRDGTELLLANVPNDQLNTSERASRRPTACKAVFSIHNTNTKVKSLMFRKYQTYFQTLIPRLHVDCAILDYNYIRLEDTIHLCHESYKRTVPRAQGSGKNFIVDDSELPQLLEFYLQIDVDLFYMKTCSFRQAQPRSATEGLFCSAAHQCSYAMAPCGRCKLCILMKSSTTRYQPCPIQFNLYQKHRFVNGYESILNCPARCDTRNIIYALTCLCRQYDFIGETSDSLWTRLSSHQTFVDRLIVEQLVGTKNYQDFYESKTKEIEDKNRSRLYQHAMRCSQAIQAFLNVNKAYWAFVPVPTAQATTLDANYHARVSTFTIHEHTEEFLFNLPKPPVGYKFTRNQIEEQKRFFSNRVYTEKRNDNYTTYIGTIIAVLPPNISKTFRDIIHFLFVSHTESKLNTLGHIFLVPSNYPLHHSVWCANLLRP